MTSAIPGLSCVMVYPSQQLSTTQPLAHFPSGWDGGENWKGQSEKTHGLR